MTAALRALLAAQRGQLAQQLLLLRVEPGRGLHVGVDDEVAAAGAAQVGDAEAAQGHRVAGLGAAT